MAEDDIIQRISIEGEEDVNAALKSMGDAADNAFGQLTTAASAASDALTNLEETTATAMDSLKGGNIGAIDTSSIEAAGQAMTDLGSASEEALGSVATAAGDANEALATVGEAAATAGEGMAELGSAGGEAAQGVDDAGRATSWFAGILDSIVSALSDAAEQFGLFGKEAEGATEGMETAGESTKGLATEMRALGHVAELPELRRLAALMHVLGGSTEVAATAIGLLATVIAVELAKSATEAALKFRDMAVSLGLTTHELSELQHIGSAAGVSVDDMNQSLGALSKMTQTAATNYQQMVETLRSARDDFTKLAEAQDTAFAKQSQIDAFNNRMKSIGISIKGAQDALKSMDLADQAKKIQELAQTDPAAAQAAKTRASYQAFIDTMNEVIAKEQEQQKTSEQTAQRIEQESTATDAMVAAAKKQRDAANALTTSLDDLNSAANKAKDPLTALGLSGTDSAGKLSKAQDVLVQLADRLGQVKDESSKLKIMQDLQASGMKAGLVVALSEGAEALKKFQEEADHKKDVFTLEDTKKAAAFAKATDELKESFAHFAAQIGVGLIPLIQGMSQQFADFPQNMRNIIRTIEGINKAIDDWVKGVKEGFGKAWDAITQAVKDAWDGILKFFKNLPGNVADIFKGVGGKIADLWNSGIESIKEGWNKLVEWFKNLTIVKFFEDATDKIGELWDEMCDYITEAWNSFVKWFEGTWAGKVLAKIQAALDQLKKAKDEANKGTGDTGTGGGTSGGGGGTFGEAPQSVAPAGMMAAVETAASGGLIRGPGTDTSDSILARLSSGEFVTRAAAVRFYGANLLHAINNMRLDPDLLPAMALGGMVPDHFKFAGRGPAPGGRPIHLTIDGTTFRGLSAPQETAERIVKFAVARQVATTGRKPSWVR